MATKLVTQQNLEMQRIVLDRELNVLESVGELLLAHEFMTEAKIGQPLEIQLTSFWNKDVARKAAQVLDEGKTFSKTFTTSTDAHFPLSILVSLEPFVEKERIAGIVLTAKNISEPLRLRNQELLRDKMAHLSTMAAQISDKLNNPLASVLNRIGYLLVEDLTNIGATKLKGELETIQEQLFSMSLITNALQSFSLDSPGDTSYVDINDILSKTIDLSKFLRIQGNVEYQIKLAGNLPPIVGCDVMLEQALLNLVQNALEAMPTGGTLTITSSFDSVSKKYVNVVIKDTGIGIPKKDLEHVYDPFFKTKDRSHAGLGLSISYGIIMNHNASMEIDSKVGKGTKISILLPIYSENK
jgi:two-component system, NtrC family, sensor kinase